jgi:hypothetical protein
VPELIYRFLVGGTIVSAFAVLGDVLRPKSLAGLFAAAPSVAISTLGLTILSNGKGYAALEARSMIAGAAGFFLYACVCQHVLARWKLHSAAVSVFGLAVWFVGALSIWLVVFRR